MTLVFDTETTGKCNFKNPPDHPDQPFICQLGAILYDDKEQIRGELNVIIKPTPLWRMEQGAADIHGITTSVGERYGIPIGAALYTFAKMAECAIKGVCHNSQFDRLMLNAEYGRHEKFKPLNRLPKLTDICTMKYMTNVCQLPGRYGYKWPTLQEAHKHCFGHEFDGAHDAMADVRACARIYFWMVKNKII